MFQGVQVSTVVGPGVRTKEISRALICISLQGGHFILVSTLQRECVMKRTLSMLILKRQNCCREDLEEEQNGVEGILYTQNKEPK